MKTFNCKGKGHKNCSCKTLRPFAAGGGNRKKKLDPPPHCLGEMQDRAPPGFQVGGGVDHLRALLSRSRLPPGLPRLKVDEKIRECTLTPHPYSFYHHMTQAWSRKNQWLQLRRLRQVFLGGQYKERSKIQTKSRP